MTFALAVTLPVCLFILQLMLCFQFAVERLIPVYLAFLFCYYFGVVFGKAMPVRRPYDQHLTSFFTATSKVFIALKYFILIYFSLIFIEYVSANGYKFVRGYMLGDEIKGSMFYSLPLMYIDAYIVQPLNFIFLAILLFAGQKRLAIILGILLFIEYVIIFAGRMLFYNMAMLAVFYLIHKRIAFSNILSKIAAVLGVALLFGATLLLSLALLFLRDNAIDFEGGESVADAIVQGVVNYHVIPPLILDDITQGSDYFKSHVGYGLATFGFLFDPVIGMFLANPKDYMASKLLSAEAQNFFLVFGDQHYNAFPTFLYAAMFDFGVLGPYLYGLFFGFLVSYSYNRRDVVGGVYYVVVAYFVYFNSFTFYITGEWFFVLIIAPLAFRRLPLNVGKSRGVNVALRST